MRVGFIILFTLIALPYGVRADLLAEGQRLFETSGCIACHGRGGRSSAFPKLAGQNSGYVFNQLWAFKNGQRTHGRAELMQVMTSVLDVSQMKALAHYIQRMDDPDRPLDHPIVYEDALVWGAGSQAELERAFGIPLPRTVPTGMLLLTIDHRNRQPMDRRMFYDFAGFDAEGTLIGLGLRYGLRPGFDIGVFRINGAGEEHDELTADARWRLLREGSALVDLSLDLGASWYSNPDRPDGWGGWGSFAVGRSVGSRLYLSAAILHHTNANAPGVDLTQPESSTAFLATLHCRILHEASWVAEVNSPLAGRNAHTTGWATGVKVITPRHTLSLLVSNTQRYSPGGLASGTPGDAGDLRFGFSIAREFSIF